MVTSLVPASLRKAALHGRSPCSAEMGISTRSCVDLGNHIPPPEWNVIPKIPQGSSEDGAHLQSSILIHKHHPDLSGKGVGGSQPLLHLRNPMAKNILLQALIPRGFCKSLEVNSVLLIGLGMSIPSLRGSDLHGHPSLLSLSPAPCFRQQEQTQVRARQLYSQSLPLLPPGRFRSSDLI